MVGPGKLMLGGTGPSRPGSGYATAYDIDNQLFIPSTVTTTRSHTKKSFKQHTNSYTRSKLML